MIKKSQFDPKRILLIRTDRIGDVILTLPMVDTLAANFPGAKIDFLVKKRVQELISDYSNINKVHAIEKETVSEIRQICKTGGYDLAVVVSPKFSMALGAYLGGVKHRLGTRNRWYSFLFNLRHAQHRKHSTKHEIQYNLDMLDELNCFKIDGLKPVLKVTNEYIRSASRKVSFLNGHGNFIVIHIPSLGSARVWSNSNFTRLINLINEDMSMNIDIVLTGTEEDLPQIEAVMAGVKDNRHVYPVTNFNLNELAALLSMSKLFIGNSTGPIHIAAAVGTFVVGIYSPVRAESPTRWGPVTDKKKVFTPESDDDSRDVMDEIKPEEVYRYVKDYLLKNS
jgi:ADP-heptose:LPS heptosyltransferase